MVLNRSVKRLLAVKEIGILIVLVFLSILINFANPVFFTFDNII
jgi:hypothetical protein